jgi:hypothetical protein
MVAGRRTVAGALAALVLASAATVAAATGDRATMVGQVVAIRLTTATENLGAFTEIQVRTERQQEAWLRLGPAGPAGERFRVGDRIRARILRGAPGEPALVCSIRNERTRERLQIRDRDGALLPDRDRDREQGRDRDGSPERGPERGPGRPEGPGGGGGAGGRPDGGGRP